MSGYMYRHNYAGYGYGTGQLDQTDRDMYVLPPPPPPPAYDTADREVAARLRKYQPS